MILLTGGSGLLGRHLRALLPSIAAPGHAEMDIADLAAVRRVFEKIKPTTVLHAAAMTATHAVNAHPAGAILSNIVGTANIAVAALELKIRLVYISTDYVYPDTPGPHREDEPLKPANQYTWTKLGGECAVTLVPGSLIIRTTFGARPCDYDRAAIDKITSKQYVDIAAPQILALAQSNLTGIVNLGGPAITMFDYARESRPDVRPIKRSEIKDPIPADTSLDLARLRDWEKLR